MGEAHESSPDGFEDVVLDLESTESQTATIFGEKIYVIEGRSHDNNLSMGIRIFDMSMRKWEIPTVLGMIPNSCKRHSAVLLNNGRILVLKGDSLDSCFWFLEVDTPFVQEQGKRLDGVVVAWSKGMNGEGAKPVIISGPSGVGKGTLINKLMNEFPTTFGFSVSHTTRAPREREEDGVHYHFTKRFMMEKDIQDGKFLESAHVHGNLYGTSIEAVEEVTDSGKRCILDIDVQGARSVKASSLEVISIFICPPSLEELEKRLRGRGTETDEQVQKRLRNAIAELEQGKSLGLFDHVLVNDDLETCYLKLKKILNLNGSYESLCQPSERIELPKDYSVSIMGVKVLIHCGADENRKTSNILYVFDTSSLKGGAPGRTRGMNIYSIDPFTEGLNGLKQVNKTSY